MSYQLPASRSRYETQLLLRTLAETGILVRLVPYILGSSVGPFVQRVGSRQKRYFPQSVASPLTLRIRL